VHDIQWLLNLMPHRYPFLLVDRILEVDERRAVGLKNVTYNEPFFQGHFPKWPVMPGVLIVEAMAQVASAVLYRIPDVCGDHRPLRRHRRDPVPPAGHPGRPAEDRD